VHARSTRMRLGPTWAGSVSARWASRRRGDRPSEAGHGRSCPSELAVPATASARPRPLAGPLAAVFPGGRSSPYRGYDPAGSRQPELATGRMQVAVDGPSWCELGSGHSRPLRLGTSPRLAGRPAGRRAAFKTALPLAAPDAPPNNSAPATFRWTVTSAVGIAYAGLCTTGTACSVGARAPGARVPHGLSRRKAPSASRTSRRRGSPTTWSMPAKARQSAFKG
jgi:hypothetical protein